MSEKTAAEMLRELDEQATNVPWTRDDVIAIGKSLDLLHADVRLIATLRNALPELAALVEAADDLIRNTPPGARRTALRLALGVLTEKLRREVGDGE